MGIQRRVLRGGWSFASLIPVSGGHRARTGVEAIGEVECSLGLVAGGVSASRVSFPSFSRTAWSCPIRISRWPSARLSPNNMACAGFPSDSIKAKPVLEPKPLAMPTSAWWCILDTEEDETAAAGADSPAVSRCASIAATLSGSLSWRGVGLGDRVPPVAQNSAERAQAKALSTMSQAAEPRNADHSAESRDTRSINDVILIPAIFKISR